MFNPNSHASHFRRRRAASRYTRFIAVLSLVFKDGGWRALGAINIPTRNLRRYSNQLSELLRDSTVRAPTPRIHQPQQFGSTGLTASTAKDSCTPRTTAVLPLPRNARPGIRCLVSAAFRARSSLVPVPRKIEFPSGTTG